MNGAETRVFLGLGSNLGDREHNLRAAVARLDSLPDSLVARVSGVFESEPWGLADQPDFLNAVVECHTTIPPLDLFREVKAIEIALGRIGAPRYHARLIDIDILLFGSEVVESNALLIPHPAMQKRRFVLAPLAELAPAVRHPVLGSTIADLLAVCPDMGRIRKTDIAIPVPGCVHLRR